MNLPVLEGSSAAGASVSLAIKVERRLARSTIHSLPAVSATVTLSACGKHPIAVTPAGEVHVLLFRVAPGPENEYSRTADASATANSAALRKPHKKEAEKFKGVV